VRQQYCHSPLPSIADTVGTSFDDDSSSNSDYE
jgi:hypothetical protein